MIYQTIVYWYYASQFNNITILVTMVTHNFPVKMVSMITNLMCHVDYIIVGQNTKYGEEWA